MTDNELLQAMSDMMDNKLKPVNIRLERVEQTQQEMSGRMDKMDKNFERVDERLERVEKTQKEMSDKMDCMDGRLKKIEVTQENIILPRLQTIEACYTSTFERYQKGVEKIENMSVDIDVIKKIVEDHGERFRKFRVVKP